MRGGTRFGEDGRPNRPDHDVSDAGCQNVL